jgi:hypothetical protein
LKASKITDLIGSKRVLNHGGLISAQLYRGIAGSDPFMNSIVGGIGGRLQAWVARILSQLKQYQTGTVVSATF